MHFFPTSLHQLLSFTPSALLTHTLTPSLSFCPLTPSLSLSLFLALSLLLSHLSHSYLHKELLFFNLSFFLSFLSFFTSLPSSLTFVHSRISSVSHCKFLCLVLGSIFICLFIVCLFILSLIHINPDSIIKNANVEIDTVIGGNDISWGYMTNEIKWPLKGRRWKEEME